MTIEEAIKTRHTIRNYNGKALEPTTAEELSRRIENINQQSGLHFQLINGEKDVLTPYTIHYGKWSGVTNIISLVGKDSDDLDELCGYYGEQLVLWAVLNGLKTGWVETQLNKESSGIRVPVIGDGERLVITICIGYSEETGNAHKIKTVEEMSETDDPTGMPDWFQKGMQYAVLAPSAGNQQLFKIHLNNGRLSIDTVPGFLEKVDLGIAKYHFELGSGVSHDQWN